ncbi:MAG: hypothetical protein AAF423_01245 [Pseudomonadota bacterium]
MAEDIRRNIDQGSMLCNRVVLDNDADQINWDVLIAELDAARKKRINYGVVQSAGEFPFADIIIKDNQSTQQTLATSLSEELEILFADTSAGFSCASYRDSAVGSRYAFFGHGVFAPIDGAAEHSAELHFSWSAPNEDGEIDPKFISQPSLQTDSYLAGGWHTGQKGIAIGFSANVAPVTIELPTDLNEEARKAFRSVFLFLGRDTAYVNPEISLWPTEGEEITTNASLAESSSMEMLMQGHWVEIKLRAGGYYRNLWCRYKLRSGAGTFTKQLPKKQGHSVLAVRGFLMPEINMWHWLGGISRWFVHFDSSRTLRHSDFSETQVSVVRQSMKRLAAYDHQPNVKRRWTPGEFLKPGIQKIELGGDCALKLESFPGKVGFLPGTGTKVAKAAKNLREQLRRFYRSRSWILVHHTDDRDIGYLDCDDGSYELKCAPISDADSEDANNKLGIDWLNKMAQLEVNSVLCGAALYWSSLGFDSEILRTDNVFEVKLSGGNVRDPFIYRIRPGERGMVGPLYVENVLLTSEKQEPIDEL